MKYRTWFYLMWNTHERIHWPFHWKSNKAEHAFNLRNTLLPCAIQLSVHFFLLLHFCVSTLIACFEDTKCLPDFNSTLHRYRDEWGKKQMKNCTRKKYESNKKIWRKNPNANERRRKEKRNDWSKKWKQSANWRNAHFWSCKPMFAMCKRTFVCSVQTKLLHQKSKIQIQMRHTQRERSKQQEAACRNETKNHIIVIFLYAFMSLVPFGDKNYIHSHSNREHCTQFFFLSSFFPNII